MARADVEPLAALWVAVATVPCPVPVAAPEWPAAAAGGAPAASSGADTNMATMAATRMPAGCTPREVRPNTRRGARVGRRPRLRIAAPVSRSTDRVNQAHPIHTRAARTTNTPWPVRSGPIAARHSVLGSGMEVGNAPIRSSRYGTPAMNPRVNSSAARPLTITPARPPAPLSELLAELLP